MDIIKSFQGDIVELANRLGNARIDSTPQMPGYYLLSDENVDIRADWDGIILHQTPAGKFDIICPGNSNLTKMPWEWWENRDPDQKDLRRYTVLHDGTILRIWNNGNWQVSTRHKLNAADAFWTAYSNGKRQSFLELFYDCGGGSMLEYALDPTKSYEIVLKHPRNVNVIPVSVKTLTIVSEYDIQTSQTQQWEPLVEEDIILEILKKRGLFCGGHRGFIMYMDNKRYQIDHPQFVTAEKMRQKGVMVDHAFVEAMCESKEQGDLFISLFPHQSARLQKIRNAYDQLESHIIQLKKLHQKVDFEHDHPMKNVWETCEIEDGKRLKCEPSVLWGAIRRLM